MAGQTTICLKQTKTKHGLVCKIVWFPRMKLVTACHIHGFLSSLLNKGCFYKRLMDGMHLPKLFSSQFRLRVALNYKTRLSQKDKRICMLLIICPGYYNK